MKPGSIKAHAQQALLASLAPALTLQAREESAHAA